MPNHKPATASRRCNALTVVDASYGRKAFRNDAARVAFLFERYQQLTSLLPSDTPKARRVRKVIG